MWLAPYPGTSETLNVGFRVPVSVIGMTPEFDLRVQVVLESGRRVVVGHIKGNISPSVAFRTGDSAAAGEQPRAHGYDLVDAAAGRTFGHHNASGLSLRGAAGAVLDAAFGWRNGRTREPGAIFAKLGNFEEKWWGEQDPFQREVRWARTRRCSSG